MRRPQQRKKALPTELLTVTLSNLGAHCSPTRWKPPYGSPTRKECGVRRRETGGHNVDMRVAAATFSLHRARVGLELLELVGLRDTNVLGELGREVKADRIQLAAWMSPRSGRREAQSIG